MRPTPSSALVVGRVVSSSLLVFGTRPPTFGARSARARARTHVRSGVRQVSAKKSFERDPPRAHANPKRRVGSFPSAPSPPGPTYCGPRLTPPLRRGPPLFPDKVEPVERAIRIPRPAVESHCGAIHVRAVGLCPAPAHCADDAARIPNHPPAAPRHRHRSIRCPDAPHR